jgi:hypothetical protein
MDENTQAPPLTAAPAPDTMPVRVLTQCTYGLANDVVTLPVVEALQAQLDGVADANPEAVAYALTLAPAVTAGERVIQA